MFKDQLRSLLQFFHLDLTKNLEYDRLTKDIILRNLLVDSNTIDVGCHKGEILHLMMRTAPAGKHFAFEPLPDFYQELQLKYGKIAEIHACALSDENGKTKFQYVKNAPAFSGIKKRSYLVNDPEIEEIEVEMKRLDDVIDAEVKIDLIKIDVEGGELGVLKGGIETIKRSKPIVIFEFGIGASDHYGTKPHQVHSFFTNEVGLKVNTLKGFVKKGEPLSEEGFEKSYQSNRDYYFVAHP